MAGTTAETLAAREGLTIGQIYIKIGKLINHIWYKYVHSAFNRAKN